MDTTLTTTTTPARTYFRPTTASQRQLLFSAVATGGTVIAAARRAHVGRGTYYYWRDRYATEGAAGLKHARSRAPQHPRLAPISAEICAEVLAYYETHPHERGGRTIANRLRQAHKGQSVIGHSKVAEILRLARATPSAPAAPAGDTRPTPPAPSPGAMDAGASGAAPTPPEPGPRGAPVVAPTPAGTPATVTVVHAPAPNQTVNIDLCVVPVTHDSRQAWASVSVSEAAAGATPEVLAQPTVVPTWPGQVFADATRAYIEQMQTYEAQRTAKRTAKGQRKYRRRQKQTVRQAAAIRSDELRVARRRQRHVRQAEDATWRKQRATHQVAGAKRRHQTRPERRAARAAWRQTTDTWTQIRAVRQKQVQQRTTDDTAWRQARQELRSQLATLAALPLVTVWLAILVVVDNGTRRCLQLPLFVTGVHVTAEEIVAQLQAHWPKELQFVISDNGAQFIADAFAQFARTMEFLHVRISPQRPQTNGIAERFVRTLKEWLAWHTWQSPEELTALLAEFIVYYNDRPHQGAELAGLSPNEYARELGCSTC
jgi:transposase InsO family protein